jgi:RNase P subunit RPR2
MDSAKIITCGCGSQVRLPNQSNRTFRCPVCKAILHDGLTLNVLSTQQLAAGDAAVTCPICQTTIRADESAIRCPKCDQVHHSECWLENSGCGTYGCTCAPVIEKPQPVQPTSAWGDEKQCPYCGETIKSIALRCRYCKSDFDNTDPMTRTDVRQRDIIAKERSKLKAATTVLLILSLFGLFAPVTGLIASGYLLPKGPQLRKCGPVYLVMSWAVLIISGTYTVGIAVVLIFQWF